MKRTTDPGAMTQEQRIVEIGQLLATGVRRLAQRNSTKSLAVLGHGEAQCDAVVHSTKTVPTEESA